MPQEAGALASESYMRVLLMGFAKIGKTTSTIMSLVMAFGQGYVVCCGDKHGMYQATQRTKKFTFDIIRDETDMEAALKEARAGVKEGRYKWIFVDDFSLYGTTLEGLLRDASASQNKSGQPDGRRWSPEFKQRILNTARRTFDLKAHVVFASHYIEQSGEIEDKETGTRQRAKCGIGILPMFYGSVREELPAIFQDVLFMEKDKERRVFQVNPAGVWGPGCRSVDGTRTIDADFGVFWKLTAEDVKPTRDVKAARR
jgi:hypothetical protein